MQKLFSILFFFLCAAFGVKAQIGEPSNLPNPNAPSNYYRIGFIGANKGFIYQERDTFCAKYPTVVKHLDHRFYYTNGNCTRWYGFGGDEIISFTKNASRDSVILLLRDGRRLAVKDSVGNIIINGDTTLITNILTTIINGDTTLITNIIHGDTTFFTTIINQIIDSLGPDTIRLQFPLYAITPDSIAWRRDSLPKMDYGLPGRDTTLWGNYTIIDKKYANDKFVTSVVQHVGTDSFFYWRNGVETFIGRGGSGGSTNLNIGAGYRWAIPNTNNIKTVFSGNRGLRIDSASNTNALTLIANDSLYVNSTNPNDTTLTLERLNGGVDTIIFRGTGSSGGGGSTGRFGIEDNQGIQNRQVDMQGYSLTLLGSKDSSKGFILKDTVSASASSGGSNFTNQQSSPAITLEGQGWKTAATAASQSVKWQIQAMPEQGILGVYTNLVFRSSENGGLYNDYLTLRRSGVGNENATFIGSVASSSFVAPSFVGGSVTATQAIINTNWAFGNNSSQDGFQIFGTTAASAGTPSVWSPRLHFRGLGWSGAASQAADFGEEVEPLSGASPVTADLVWTAATNSTISTTTAMPTRVMRLSNAGSVAVGTNPVNTPSAVLSISSTTKGVLFPQMTQAQRDAISLTNSVNFLVLTAGSGYTNGTYSVTFSGGAGSGAVATVTVAGGVYSSYYISNGGSGYTSAPTATISAGAGSGGVVTPTITSMGGLTIYCTDCTATDASTGVMQSYSTSAAAWKNYW